MTFSLSLFSLLMYSIFLVSQARVALGEVATGNPTTTIPSLVGVQEGAVEKVSPEDVSREDLTVSSETSPLGAMDQVVIPADAAPQDSDYAPLLNSQERKELLPALEGGGGEAFYRLKSFPGEALGCHLVTYRDLLEALNWVGAAGSDQFYREEMYPYFKKEVKKGSWWGGDTTYHFSLRKDYPETQLDQSALLGLESARAYTNIRVVHHWLAQRLQSVAKAFNNGGQLTASFSGENRDRLALYFQEKRFWPLQTDFSEEERYHAINIFNIRQIIKESPNIGAYWERGQSPEKITKENAEDVSREAVYQLPSQEELAQEAQEVAQSLGQESTLGSLWSREELANSSKETQGPRELKTMQLVLREDLEEKEKPEYQQKGNALKRNMMDLTLLTQQEVRSPTGIEAGGGYNTGDTVSENQDLAKELYYWILILLVILAAIMTVIVVGFVVDTIIFSSLTLTKIFDFLVNLFILAVMSSDSHVHVPVQQSGMN